MTKFVEQCNDFIVREQRGFFLPVAVSDRRREITIEIRDRYLDTMNCASACACLVHPCAPPFGCAGIEIDIKLSNEIIRPVTNTEKTHIGMSYGRHIRLNDQPI